MKKIVISQKVKKILRSLGLAFSFIWASFNAYNNNVLFLAEKSSKEAILKVCDSTEANYLTRIDNLKKEKQFLRSEVIESFTKSIENTYDLDDIVRPVWRKRYNDETGTFIMHYLNNAYAKQFLKFGVKRSQYIGSQDFLAHPSDIAEAYKIGDLKALNSDIPIILYENYRRANGTYGTLKVVKWKVVKYENGERSKYIYGMVLELLN